MVKNFSTKDVVSFTNWLMANQESRERSIKATLEEIGDYSEEDLKERLSKVTHADIANWEASKNPKSKRTKFIVKKAECSLFSGIHCGVTLSPVTNAYENNSIWPEDISSGKIKLDFLNNTEFYEGAEYYVEFIKAKRSPNEVQVRIDFNRSDGVTRAVLKGVYSFHGKFSEEVIVSDSQYAKFKFPAGNEFWINVPEGADVQECFDIFAASCTLKSFSNR